MDRNLFHFNPGWRLRLPNMKPPRTPNLETLAGVRLVECAAPPPGARIEPSRIVEVTGGMPVNAKPLSDFPACGCECSGQFSKVRCADVKCEGCTISVDNEACHHVFMHFGRVKQREGLDGKWDGPVVLKGARRRKHVDRHLLGDVGCEGKAHRLGFATGPDGDKVMIFLNKGALAGRQGGDRQDKTFRASRANRTVTDGSGKAKPVVNSRRATPQGDN